MIVIASSDPKLVNRWNRALGKKYPSYTVSQKTALVRAVSSLKPRLLILHITFPRLRVERELPAIQGLSPLTKVLVLSDSPTTSEGISVLKAGAKGYCSQNISAALLKKAVKNVLQNELWAGRKIVTKLVEEMIAHSRHEMLAARSKTPLDTLSTRKRQIADLVIKGDTNKEIASRLNISEDIGRPNEGRFEAELMKHGAMTLYVMEGLRLHLMTAAAFSAYHNKMPRITGDDVIQVAEWKCWAWPWC